MPSSENGEILKNWPEIQRVIAEERCELVLAGILLTERIPNIDDSQLQSFIFSKNSLLNFVDLSSTGLSLLHSSIANAQQLTNLVLRSNSLKSIPYEIGELKKLKLIDFSYNNIEKLPDSIGNLPNLTSLNLAHNKISLLPDLSGLISLQLLDVSHNELKEFPSTLHCSAPKIQTILLNSNHISEVPANVESVSEQLKMINLSANDLRELPLPLAKLPKLKTLDLTENKFVDKRFGKLAEDKRHTASSLIDYLKKKAPTSTKGSKKTLREKSEEDEGDSESVEGPHITVHFGTKTTEVRRTVEVAEIRPHIALCILRNIQMDEGKLKLILAIQNKLHDTVCGQRTLASIGTHDCSKFRMPLTYLALEPENLVMTPLHRHTTVSGQELITALTAEAELIRKKQKRKTYSSIHKYLHLVEKLTLYPCIVDAERLVMSFAPVTNCDATKLSMDTHDILVEVTSNDSQLLCRQVMDRFIEEIAKNNFSTNLVVEQVKIYQHTGELLIAYPGKLDLQLKSVPVKRELVRGSEEVKNSEEVTMSSEGDSSLC